MIRFSELRQSIPIAIKPLGTTDSFPFSTITMLSKSTVVAAVIVQALCIAVTESSSDVIFTGYIEGTSNNKVNCGSVSGFIGKTNNITHDLR
jgi:hypothetical protein